MEFIYGFSLCQILIGITFISILAFYLYALCPHFDVAKKFDRSFSTKAKSQIVWLLIIIVFTFVIMLVGAYILSINEHFGPDDIIFRESDLPLLEYVFALMLDPGQLDHLNSGSAHLGGLLLAFLGIITITGITISTISNMVQRRVNNYLNGEVRYKSFYNHYVIIGFNNLALTIIEKLLNEPNNKNNPCSILLMSSEDTQEIRRTINTVIRNEHEQYITIYRGRKDTQEDINSLNIAYAKKVFLIGEKEEVNRDATNIEALQKIVEYLNFQHTNTIIPIMVLFDYQTTYAAFQITDLSKEWRNKIDFQPFNFYENWTKKLLFNRTYTNYKRETAYYPSLDREPIGLDSNKQVHLVIFSMSRMGVALGTMAAHLCHFPNFVTKGIKTRITFVTPEAETEKKFFKGRYAHFFNASENTNYIDIEFDFINGKAEEDDVRNMLVEWAEDEKQILSIAVCQRDPSKNMAIGLYLPDVIYEKRIPIFIRQKSSGALLSLLNCSGETSKYKNVYPFGMLEDCFDLDDEDRKLAKLFNSCYDDFKDVDNCEEAWSKLQVVKQWSNLYLVYTIPFKLNSIKPLPQITKNDKDKVITLKNNYNRIYDLYKGILSYKGEINLPEDKDETNRISNIMARVEHNRWVVEELLLGYRIPTDKEIDDYRKIYDKLKEYVNANSSFEKLEVYKKRWTDKVEIYDPVERKMKKLYDDVDAKRKELKSRLVHYALYGYDELDEDLKFNDYKMNGYIPEIMKRLSLKN